MQLDSWQTYAVASAFFAGLTAIFGKIGVTGINSNLATFVRTIIIFGITTALIAFRREWSDVHKIDQRSLLFLIFSGIATGFSWLCYYRALTLAPASHVAIVDKSSVVFTILLAALFLHEPLSLRVIAGCLLVVVGSLLIVS